MKVAMTCASALVAAMLLSAFAANAAPRTSSANGVYGQSDDSGTVTTCTSGPKGFCVER